MTPKTQSVCKHCSFSAEEHPVRYQSDGKYAYCGKFEPVAEPASSTGEPTLKPIPEGWSGWRTADGEPLKDAPYGPNGMEGDYGL